MSDILCVTAENLCKEDFLIRIEEIAKARPRGIILREKHLSEYDYKSLAFKVMQICRRYNTPCILHSFVAAATELNAPSIHLPMHILRQMCNAEKERFKTIGASCHSPDEAQEAEKLGCTYVTAGHVFDTDCKKGLPGRGLDFLRSVCESVSIPVYAIGGINGQNFDSVLRAGAKGACIMSGLMRCENVKKYLEDFENEI